MIEARPPDPIPSDFPQMLTDVRASTADMLTDLVSLTEQDVRRPSLLPSWSVGHVLSHLARNADAMIRSLNGAMRHEPNSDVPAWGAGPGR